MRFSGYAIGVLFAILSVVGCTDARDNEPEKPKTEAEKRRERIAQQDAAAQARLNAPVNANNCKDYQTKYSAQDNLAYSIYYYKFDCIQKSIDLGAEVNKKASRRTMLYRTEGDEYPVFLIQDWANAEAQLKTYEILVKNGADLGLKSDLGRTGFEQILRTSSSNIGTLVKKHEVRFANLLVNALGKYRLNNAIPGMDERLLTWLVSFRMSANTIQSVINKGASKNYNLTNSPGKSLLDHVVVSGYAESFCISLLKSGAYLTDYNGTLSFAMDRNYRAFISEVISKQQSLQSVAVVRAMISKGNKWLDQAEQLVDSNPKMDLGSLTNENIQMLVQFDRIRFLDKVLSRSKNSYSYSKNSCNSDPLNFAIAYEKSAAIRKLVESGYDVNKPTCPSLKVAMGSSKSRKDFDYILSKTNFSNNSEANELLVNADSVATLEKMIKAGADINAVNKNGQTVLDSVLRSKESSANLEVPLKLISLGAKFGEEGLQSAVRSGNVGMVKALIAKGANVKTVSTYKYVKFGSIPLLFFANDVEVMQVLIDAGASPYDLSGDGGTILHYYVREARDYSYSTNSARALKILKYLSRFESLDWNKPDPWGFNLITCILSNMSKYSNQNDEIVEFLIAKGVNVNTPTTSESYYGATALHLATHLSTVEILLKAGADKNIVNKKNQRPLVQAEALLAETKISMNSTEKTLRSYETSIEEAYAKGDEYMIRSNRQSIEIYRKGLKEQSEKYQMSLRMVQLLN